jgi:hypothetical protein
VTDADGRERRVHVFLFGQARCKTAQASRVGEVRVDIDAGGGVEGEFGGRVDAPPRAWDEEDGFRWGEWSGGVADAGVEGERGVGGAVEDAEGKEIGGVAVAVDIYSHVSVRHWWGEIGKEKEKE